MQDKKAIIWDKRNSGDGEPYKKYVTDPILIELGQPLDNLVILEQGCGNGYLAKKLVQFGPKKIILLDLFDSNLEFARKNLESFGSCQFIRADLNKKLGLESNLVDIVISNMVLSEIENFQIAINETYRILKSKGIYLISVLHPAYMLKKYLVEKNTGNTNNKINPARKYFDRGKSEFRLGVDTHEIIKAPHFHRTIDDYTNALLSAGFKLERLIEPELNTELLTNAPRFKEDADCPLALIIKARK